MNFVHIRVPWWSAANLVQSGSELEPLEAVAIDLLEEGHQLDGEVDKDSTKLSLAKNLFFSFFTKLIFL